MYSDYTIHKTIHKDEARRQRYIARHQKNEDFNKSGFYTSGFWAKHLLWNLQTLEASIRDENKSFLLMCSNTLSTILVIHSIFAIYMYIYLKNNVIVLIYLYKMNLYITKSTRKNKQYDLLYSNKK